MSRSKVKAMFPNGTPGPSLEAGIPVAHLWGQQRKSVKGKVLAKTGSGHTLTEMLPR